MQKLLKQKRSNINSNELIPDDRYRESIEFKVGDTVKVIDGSHNQGFWNTSSRHGIDPLFANNNATVVRTDEPVIQGWGCGDSIFYTNLDLLLEFPDGEHVWCCSYCCRPLENIPVITPITL